MSELVPQIFGDMSDVYIGPGKSTLTRLADRSGQQASVSFHGLNSHGEPVLMHIISVEQADAMTSRKWRIRARRHASDILLDFEAVVDDYESRSFDLASKL